MVFAAITGKTIRKAVKTGVRSDPKIRKQMSITDITGVAEIIEKRGLKKEAARLSRPEAIPQTRPRGTEISMPPITRRKLKPRLRKNSGLPKREINFFMTGRGPGKSKLLPNRKAPSCHRTSRTSIPANNQRPFFSRFIISYL
jgi:hypothetical protein